MATNAPLQGAVFGSAARYFLEVARTGSIIVAAAELHVASSAISRQIATLEQAVGCVLFERRAAACSSARRARGELAVLALPDLDLHPRLVQLLAHDNAPAESLKTRFAELLAQTIVALG